MEETSAGVGKSDELEACRHLTAEPTDVSTRGSPGDIPQFGVVRNGYLG